MLQTKTKVIILLGPPGAGKGSQAALLKEKGEVAHISTGDLLRENIKKGTEEGLEAKTFMDKGELVPDNLIFEMLFGRVAEDDCQKGFILDGFPRNLAQAEELKKKLNNDFDVIAINLAVSDEKLIERITKRELCGDCQTPYHPDFSPPKFAGLCDNCAGKLIKRSDDTREVVEKRLSVYHEKTAPLIDFYTKEGVLHTIDASETKHRVLSSVLSLL